MDFKTVSSIIFAVSSALFFTGCLLLIIRQKKCIRSETKHVFRLKNPESWLNILLTAGFFMNCIVRLMDFAETGGINELFMFIGWLMFGAMGLLTLRERYYYISENGFLTVYNASAEDIRYHISGDILELYVKNGSPMKMKIFEEQEELREMLESNYKLYVG